MKNNLKAIYLTNVISGGIEMQVALREDGIYFFRTRSKDYPDSWNRWTYRRGQLSSWKGSERNHIFNEDKPLICDGIRLPQYSEEELEDYAIEKKYIDKPYYTKTLLAGDKVEAPKEIVNIESLSGGYSVVDGILLSSTRKPSSDWTHAEWNQFVETSNINSKYKTTPFNSMSTEDIGYGMSWLKIIAADKKKLVDYRDKERAHFLIQYIKALELELSKYRKS